jgi:hypothetical protein
VKKKKLKQRLNRALDDRDRWVGRYAQARREQFQFEEQVRLLDAECRELAHWLMSEWVHVDESKVAEVDLLLNRFLGGNYAR